MHCLYLIQELLGPIEDVDADWRSLGGDPNLAFDEWRALVRCERGLGQFQLTWNAKPMQSQMIIHGTKGVLRVDLFAMFHGTRAATPLPKAAERLVNAFTDSIQPLVDVPVGVWQVRAQGGPGRSRACATSSPTSTAGSRGRAAAGLRRGRRGDREWVEKVARAAEADQTGAASRASRSPTRPFLVTGASGSLGRQSFVRLLADGKRVRVFVRRIPERPLDGVEYCVRQPRRSGRRRSRGARRRARDPLRRRDEGRLARAQRRHRRRHAERDRRLPKPRREAARAHLVDVGRRLGRLGRRRPVSESTPLEPRADERGAYTRAKLEAERAVTEAAAAGLPCVILRPGQIFRRRHPADQRRVARSAGGRWLVLGDGKLALPLVYIDDVVDAITAASRQELVAGEVIQIIDP